jgi:hypothetical protein
VSERDFLTKVFDDTPASNSIISNPGRGDSAVIGISHQDVGPNQAGEISAIETEPSGSTIFRQRQADKGDAVILSTASQQDHDQESPNIFRRRPIDRSDTDLVLTTDKEEGDEESPNVVRQRQNDKNGIDAISVLGSSSRGGTTKAPTVISQRASSGK